MSDFGKLRLEQLLKQQNNLKSSDKAKIISQLDQFHAYYNTRYQNLKSTLQKVTQQNSQYAAKLLKYQKKFQQYRRTLEDVSDKTQQLEKQIQNLTVFKLQTTKEFQNIVHENQVQIQNLKKQTQELKTAHFHRRKYKFNPVLTSRNSLQLQNNLLQIDQCRGRNEQLELQLANSQNEKRMLLNKIGRLQTQLKFQEEKFMTATLSLQLDHQANKKKIQRLKQQVKTYEKKFTKLLKQNYIVEAEFGTGRSDDQPLTASKNLIAKKVNQGIDLSLSYPFDEMQTGLSQQMKTQFFQERTHKKIAVPSSQRGHKRHFSTNLETKGQERDSDRICHPKVRGIGASRKRKF